MKGDAVLLGRGPARGGGPLGSRGRGRDPPRGGAGGRAGVPGAAHLGWEPSSPKQSQDPPGTEDGARRCLPLVMGPGPAPGPRQLTESLLASGPEAGSLVQPPLCEHPSGAPDSVVGRPAQSLSVGKVLSALLTHLQGVGSGSRAPCHREGRLQASSVPLGFLPVSEHPSPASLGLPTCPVPHLVGSRLSEWGWRGWGAPGIL